MNPVIGICRFSFVGRGDWAVFGDRSIDHTEAEFRQAHADEMYAPARMERRFVTLEHLLLKSMQAQTEQNFVLIILTSDLMPEAYQKRLQRLTVSHANVRVIYSDAPDVDTAIIPEVFALNEEYGAKLVQFRIDDDDCLTHTYVETLQDITQRFEGMGSFDSAGAAVRYGRPNISIFGSGHFALQRRFNCYLVNEGYGHFSTKLVDQDSTKLSVSERAKQDHTEIKADEFAELSQRYFPFIDVKTCFALLAQNS